MGEAEGLNDAAELQWGGCAERNDIVVEHQLAQVLLGDGRADQMPGLVLPLPLHVTQPNQGQQLQGWMEGTGCKEEPGANSALPLLRLRATAPAAGQPQTLEHWEVVVFPADSQAFPKGPCRAQTCSAGWMRR